MLQLSRKRGEKIIITTASGERIEVIFNGFHQGTARLGFIAGKDVVIDREEIHNRKQAEPLQQQAAQAPVEHELEPEARRPRIMVRRRPTLKSGARLGSLGSAMVDAAERESQLQHAQVALAADPA